MTVVKVETLDDLHHIIDTHDGVVVSFSAPAWCVPCRRLQPHFEAAAERIIDLTFVEVDIDKAPDIRVAYNIMSVPFLVRFDRGQLVGEVKGRTFIQLQNELSS